MENILTPAPIEAYSTKQLAVLYKLGVKSMLTWLKDLQPELGRRVGYYWSLRQVEFIFKTYGTPNIQTKSK